MNSASTFPSAVKSGADGSEEPFHGTTEQPVDQTLVRRIRPSNEPILTSIQALDVELLTGLNLVLIPEFDR